MLEFLNLFSYFGRSKIVDPATESNLVHSEAEVGGFELVLLDESGKIEEEEEIDPRSPSRVYTDCTAHWRASLSLHLWKEISQYRADHPHSRMRKAIASGAYFSAGVFGILETVVRGAGAFVLGNPVSRTIPVILYRDTALYEQNSVVLRANRSVNLCAQATFQNFFSAFTNILSHNANMWTAEKVEKLMGNKMTIVIDFAELNVTSVFKAVIILQSLELALFLQGVKAIVVLKNVPQIIRYLRF